MTSDEWREILRLLQLYKAKLTVSVTATWAESEKQLIPFPHKFPEEAAALKEGSNNGLLEIANHGLTHCVVAKNVFKPKWVSGNRQFHREFWEWIPADVQEDHIRRSQQILTDYFENEILTFVPPGNVYTEKTLEIAERFGLRYVSCNTPPRRHRRMAIVGDRQVLAFHDKDIVTNGVSWFKDLLERNADKKFRFVRDLGKLMLASQPQDRMA
jgi:peptidoglycan/xylan/chitin deacetylase (PgdA/CDA1 family)